MPFPSNAPMPWDIAAYLRDTMFLSAEEHGCYLLLLAEYWVRQGPLPDDDQILARICRVSDRRWKALRPRLLQFFTVTDGVWRQKRADQEIAAKEQSFARLRQRGQRANQARWASLKDPSRIPQGSKLDPSRIEVGVLNGSLKDPSRIPQGSNKHCAPSPPPFPLSSPPHTPPLTLPLVSSSPRRVTSDEFPSEILNQVEEVWRVWPKKIDTLEAKAAIAGAIRRDGFEMVIDGTRKVAAANALQKTVPVGRYLPKPVEFFEGGKYLDDPSNYGPRAVKVDPDGLRKLIQERERILAEHAGNPNNAVGSLDRKKAARPEFDKLSIELAEWKKQLVSTTRTED